MALADDQILEELYRAQTSFIVNHQSIKEDVIKNIGDDPVIVQAIDNEYARLMENINERIERRRKQLINQT